MSQLVGKSGHVFAFEASEKAFVELTAMIRRKRLKNVTPVHAAITEESGGYVDLYLDERPGWNGVASTIMTELVSAERFESAKIRKVRVPSLCLDDYCAQHHIRPQFVKMDIEGAEAVALRGSGECLASCRPCMMLEYGSAGDGWPHTSLALLADQGYELLDSITYERVTPIQCHERNTIMNILAIHREAAEHTAYREAPSLVDMPPLTVFGETPTEVGAVAEAWLTRGRYVARFEMSVPQDVTVDLSVHQDGLWMRSFNGNPRGMHFPDHWVFQLERDANVRFALKTRAGDPPACLIGVRLSRVLLADVQAVGTSWLRA